MKATLTFILLEITLASILVTPSNSISVAGVDQ